MRSSHSCLEFLALLQKWNKVYNLTAVRDPQEMLTHHLLDSLAAVPPLRRHIAQAGVPAAGALARCGLGRRPARRGVCHLLPWGGRELRGHRGQEGGLHPAGGGHTALPNLHGMHARVESLVGPLTW
jgi:16S rRNA (guanine527-N7)-methyltransferase